MPWTVKDVDSKKRGLTAKQKRQWVKVANSALKSCLAKGGKRKKCEGSAIRQANAAVGAPKASEEEPVKNKQNVLHVNKFQLMMSDLVHWDVLEKKRYMVFPLVMMTEGVHNGLYYSNEELAKHPAAWNGRPVIVYHSESEEGKPISSNSPEEIEKRTIGQLFHTHHDGKLKSEAWIDPVKAEEIDEDVMTALLNGQMMEVSIAVYTDEDWTGGMWMDEEYDVSVHNLVPDHLALLPRGTGACSIADGAGAPRLNEGDDEGGSDADMAVNDLAVRALKDHGFHVQELSHENIRTSLIGEVRAQVNPGQNEYVYIRDVYDDFVVYEVEDKDGLTIFKQSYKVDKDNKIELEGDSVEVKPEVNYTPVTSEDKNGSQGTAQPKGGNTMPTREEQVEALIAAESNDWSEDDRELLTKNMSDDQFAKIEADAVEENDEDDEDKGKKKDKPKVSKKKDKSGEEEEPEASSDAADEKGKKKEKEEPLTAEQYIEQAPEGMRGTLRRAHERDKKIKAEMVKDLIANKRNKFSEEQLNGKEIEELQNLLRLAQVDKDYSGQNPAGEVTPNEDDDKVPAAPKMKFNKKGEPEPLDQEEKKKDD